MARHWSAALAMSTARSRAYGFVGAALVLSACSRRESPLPAPIASAPSSVSEAPPVARPESRPAAAAPPDTAKVAPLGAEEFASLEVEGFAPAVVSLPSGAARPRPVAVALHGNFDRPEWQCEVWRGVVGTRGFIVCPRGVPRGDVPKSMDRWEYRSAKAVEREIDAALTALSARFSAHVDPGPVLFIGFSLGAIYGSPLVQRRPEQFPRVVLVEGGQKAWTRATAAKFAEGGGLRLFIACGQAGCLDQARRLGPTFEKAGLPLRSGGSPKAGHTYDGPVAGAVASELSWLLEGDPRWEP